MNETAKQKFFDSLKRAKNAVFEDIFSRVEPENIEEGKGIVLGPLHDHLQDIPGAGYFYSGAGHFCQGEEDKFVPVAGADLGKLPAGHDGIGVKLGPFYGHIVATRSGDGPITIPEIRVRAVYDNFGQVYLQSAEHPAIKELKSRKVWSVSERHPHSKDKGRVFETGRVQDKRYMLNVHHFLNFDDDGFIKPITGLRGKPYESSDGEIFASVPSAKIIEAHVLPFVYWSMLAKPKPEDLKKLQVDLLPLYSEELDEDAREKLEHDLKNGFGGKYPGIEEFFDRCRTDMMRILPMIIDAQTTSYPYGRTFFFDKNPFYFEAVSDDGSLEAEGQRTCIGHIHGEPRRRLTLTVEASQKEEGKEHPYQGARELIDERLETIARDFI